MNKISNPDNREHAFKKFRNSIYGFVYGMTKNEKDAEDITNSSFLKLFEKKDLASMEEDGHIKAFLIATAKNETVDFYRKKKSQQKFLNSHEAALLSLSEEDWFYNDMVVEYGHVLITLINELPDRRKEILMLKYFEGMSASEISENLGISLSTVNNTLSKTYESIRSKMRDRGIKF